MIRIDTEQRVKIRAIKFTGEDVGHLGAVFAFAEEQAEHHDMVKVSAWLRKIAVMRHEALHPDEDD